MRTTLNSVVSACVVVVGAAVVFALLAPPITHCGDMRRTKALADIRGIQEALNLFRNDNGFYPTTVDGLQALVTKPANAAHFNPDAYLDKLPIDPWGNVYVYSSNGREYAVRSYDSDGYLVGEGKNTDSENIHG